MLSTPWPDQDTGERVYAIGDFWTYKITSYESLCATDEQVAIGNAHGSSVGRYNCIANLPDMKIIDFIQNLMIKTGVFCGYDENGAIQFHTLEEFKAKIESGDVYDFSGLIKNKKNDYRFNSNAQKNYIIYENHDELNKNSDGVILVDDETLETEKTLS